VSEWAQLAKWILKDWQFPEFPGPILSSHNRWLIQIPRLWRIYCSKGKAINQERHFQDMLSNLFCPIFDATLHPNDHPEVAELLKHIVGFDSVDDEGAHESSCNGSLPSMWTQDSNPEYCWQLYFLWANIEVLNAIRKSKGLNTFALRPHAGETGDVMHLATTYILSQSINHGINLEHQVSLQYLYYLDQVMF
jgi:AMP deaminase